ncbi:MAG: hypothetical protein JOZ07_14290 [Solirubrobacterales bacterium]|nr:hypothetical protein [Solirubrobacterales bacterium]
MNVTDQLGAIVDRLLDDDYVQDQLDRGLANLRKGSRRAQRKGAKQAATDRRVQDQLGAGVAAVARALQALSQPPAPRRHALRNSVLLVGLGGAAGGAALAYRQLTSSAKPTSDG